MTNRTWQENADEFAEPGKGTGGPPKNRRDCDSFEEKVSAAEFAKRAKTDDKRDTSWVPDYAARD